MSLPIGEAGGTPPVILRLVLFGALAVAGLIYVKQERVLARVGVIGDCVPSLPAAGSKGSLRSAQWWSCDEGITGYPTLELKSCVSAGFAGPRELWYCLRPIASPY
jgi:hypothetical protein